MKGWICGALVLFACSSPATAGPSSLEMTPAGPRVIDILPSTNAVNRERHAAFERRKDNDESIEWILPVTFNRDSLRSNVVEAYLFDTNIRIRRSDETIGAQTWSDPTLEYEVWEGKVDIPKGSVADHLGGPSEATFYLWNNGVVTGIIRLGQYVYRLHGSRDGSYSLSKQDLSLVPDEGDDVYAPDSDQPLQPAADPAWFPGVPSPIPPRQIHHIDVVIAFSNEAERDDQQFFIEEVKSAVADAAMAYRRSDIPLYLNVVAFARPNYSETSITRTLSDLRKGQDGPLWLVHTARAYEKADVALFVVNGNNSWPCGGVNSIGSTRNTAYFVVRRGCYDQGSIAHELGHLLGAHHNVGAVGDVPPLYEWGHGYIKDSAPGMGGGWSTLMAMPSSCANWCPRILYFSDPLKKHHGQPRGDAVSNNVAAILLNYGIMANYYDRPKPSSQSRARLHTPTGAQWLVD